MRHSHLKLHLTCKKYHGGIHSFHIQYKHACQEEVIFAVRIFCADFQVLVVLSQTVTPLSLPPAAFFCRCQHLQISCATGKMAEIIRDWITEK